MLFSSLIFLFVFLPIVLGIYFIVFKKSMLAKNMLLLFASLFFYAWGEPKFVLVMILSIIVNYIFGRIIDQKRIGGGYAKLYLCLSIIFNIGILFIFKYLNFTISNINNVFGDIIPQTNIVLPIGISFFTFQAMSYVIDVYRGTVKVQKNLLYLALYISFFPQLIAGPIVRYSDIEEQISNRSVTFDDFSEGVRRFLIGISKKVILANNFALIADEAFSNIGEETLSISFAWLGSIAYTLQIFFDFSAYSDMAIGLGRMFGFRFLENFNYPYISSSVSEFWRRWHISLGMWFRDYVYIPLGGSHVENKLLLVRNLFIVWSLTGIWHGANWTFILWGLLYFMLLTFEKLTGIPKIFKHKFSKLIYGVFTFLCVNIGWVIFRADNISQAFNYLKVMAGIGNVELSNSLFNQYLGEYWVFILIGIIYSTSIFYYLRNKIRLNKRMNKIAEYTAMVVYNFLFIISVSYLVMGAYNPFIYFNF